MGESVAPDEDGWTEAYDAEAPRADMVKRASNGTPWLLMKSQANAAAGGLFSADAMAGLVKAGDAADDALVKADYAALVKAKYSDEDRKKMAAAGQAMDDGSYPVADAEDVHNAVHAVGRGENNGHAAIRRHVIARAKALGESSQIPDTWGADGSLNASAMAKADGGDASTPGSPAWEALDAAQAQQAITQLQSLRGLVQQLAVREGAEFAAGDMDDFGDVIDLQCVDDALRCALKTLAGFLAVELDAAGDAAPAAMAKAAAAAAQGGDAVHDTITKLAGACGCPVCAGFIAGAKQHSAQMEASQPPQDANDGPADTQQAPQPAAPKPTTAAPAAVATPEQTMTKAATEPTTTTAPAEVDAGAAALIKAQKKIEKQKAKRIAAEAELAKSAQESAAQKEQLAELLKRVEGLESQPAQGSGPAMNGAQPGANPLAAPGAQPGHQAGAVAADAALLKSIADESDPVLKAGLQQRASVDLFKQIFANGPVMNPSSEDRAAVA